MQLALLGALAVAIGAVAFSLQNNVPVTVTFVVWRFDSTLALVLLVAVALGALVVALLSTPAVLKLQWSVARQRRQIAALEKANSELRSELAARGRPAASEESETTLSKMAPRAP